MPGTSALSRAKFGDFLVDFDSFELRKHGIRLKLQDQPFQILKLLLRQPGQLVTREELRMELWTESTFVDFDAGLNAAVRRLRDALNDSADEPRYIETLPRHGYRFMAPVEIATEPAPALRGPMSISPGNSHGRPEVVGSDQLATALPRENWRPRETLWRRALVLAAALVVALGMGAAALRWRVFAKRVNSGQVYSIAVLPLQNLSGDSSQDYFADGMTDALITNLAQIKSLHVISSTSSARYKGTQRLLPEIGRELNVSFIVEGSVIRAGNHVRITAQLLDAARDQHLWAGQYDRDLRDILQLQSELASAVVMEVAGRLTPDEKSRLAREVRPVSPQAYEAYLRGGYFLNKWTVEGFDKAKGYFQQSIELDAGYAQGYAGLAEYYQSVAFVGVVPPKDAWLKAEQLLEKSLQINSGLSDAHTLLGMLKLQFRCDRPAAEKELNLALELNPGDMGALDYHSYYLLEIGRMDEAIAEKKKVLEHDPLSVRTNAEFALYLLQAGRTDEAISQLQKTLELDPNYAATHMRLGHAYAAKTQYEQAVVEFKKAIALDKTPMRLAKLGELYARWGKSREAAQTIADLRAMSKQRYVPPNTVALIYSQMGQKEAAIAWLAKSKPDDEPKVSDPGFDSLRSDPQFKILEARLKPNEACPSF
jgi:TolB-like protein/DNA-binding winged helix-turn-helix (wHTH) protein/Flp pilus assembly protein TadD